MKLLDYNLEKLKSKNEYLYDCINTILADQRIYDEISNKFFVIETKNGSKTIECLSGHNKIRLNSMYNPEREAQKWVIYQIIHPWLCLVSETEYFIMR